MPRFGLLLAGANWRDRSVAAIGALFGIALAGLVATATLAAPGAGLLLAAPIGASAVLVFAVPSSPLAQPWSVIGGNVVSGVVGLGVASLLGHGALAAAVAVGLAIFAMSLLRCLHPPGGGTVLLPVLAPAMMAKGPLLALAPVTLNAVALVAAGLIFHRFSHHSYPHRPVAPPRRPRLAGEDIDAALAESGESFDISREDLMVLLDRAERHAETRR